MLALVLFNMLFINRRVGSRWISDGTNIKHRGGEPCHLQSHSADLNPDGTCSMRIDVDIMSQPMTVREMGANGQQVDAEHSLAELMGVRCSTSAPTQPPAS
jgi:hypothetical protein